MVSPGFSVNADIFESIIDWSNHNSGFLTLIIFIVTLLLGWISGIFKALIKKPKLAIELIKTPSFCSTFDTGRKKNGVDIHRTAILLYLKILNVGSEATEPHKISVGYKAKNNFIPFKWCWIEHETTLLSDFTMAMGDKIKAFPFLKQKNELISNKLSTYLKVGQSINGLVYFEQDESTGNNYPKSDVAHNVRILIKIVDSFGNKFYKRASISKVKIEAVKEHCKYFGLTRELTEKNIKDANKNSGRF